MKHCNQWLLAALMALGSIGGAWAAAGEVTHLSGILSVKHADGSTKVLSIKSEVQPGDTLNTQEDTFARVKFADGGEVVLRPNTQLKVESFAYDAAKPESDSFVLNMLKGGLRAVTGLLGKRNRDKVSFTTPTATIGIRGTHFGALFCNNDCGNVPTATGKPPENGLHVDVVSGAVSVQNGGGQQVVNAGQFAYVKDNVTVPEVRKQGNPVTIPQNIAQNKKSECVVGN